MIIAERVSGMLANYDFITADTLGYFTPRLDQAPMDAEFALAYVQEHARTPEQQEAVLAVLRTKCDILWAMLDAPLAMSIRDDPAGCVHADRGVTDEAAIPAFAAGVSVPLRSDASGVDRAGARAAVPAGRAGRRDTKLDRR